MNSRERREEILKTLQSSDRCVSASVLAERFGVTRQIIVSDVALLRSAGSRITASRQGYSIEREQDDGRLLETVVCRHSAGQVPQELYAVVDNGGAVVNVIVEHPIYGALCADLNITSRHDADEFVEKVRQSRASQLCDLTGGLHTHTLRVPDEAALARICDRLDALGILVKDEPAGRDIPAWLF